MERFLGENKLKRLMRNISRSRLTQQGLADHVQIKELPDFPKVFSHWMVMILASGPQGKIVFKTHFKSRSARLLAAPLYNLPVDQVSSDQALDCMREFANLTAGGIKRALGAHLDFHLSLPIISRGFDEIFFVDLESANSITDRWKLAYRDNEFVCSSSAEFFEPLDLSNLDENSDSGPENTTEVEYL